MLFSLFTTPSPSIDMRRRRRRRGLRAAIRRTRFHRRPHRTSLTGRSQRTLDDVGSAIMYILICESDCCRSALTGLLTSLERGRATRHRLAVLAADAADAVTAAGGLIFDRVSAGWDVRVFLAECSDPRSLHILGVDARELSEGITSADPWPDAIVVAAELYADEVRVRRYVGTASRHHCSEVAMWGGDWPRLWILASASSSTSSASPRGPSKCTRWRPRVYRLTSRRREPFRHGKRRFTIAAPLVPALVNSPRARGHWTTRRRSPSRPAAVRRDRPRTRGSSRAAPRARCGSPFAPVRHPDSCECRSRGQD